MGNSNASAGFVWGVGKTKDEAMLDLTRKVKSHGGGVFCDPENICFVQDANGARFRIDITKLATSDGRKYYRVTQGLIV